MIEVDIIGASARESSREFQTNVSILYFPGSLGIQD